METTSSESEDEFNQVMYHLLHTSEIKKFNQSRSLKLNLTNADLSNVNLTDANLTNSNLSGANLSNSNITNVNFSGERKTGPCYRLFHARKSFHLESPAQKEASPKPQSQT